MKVQAESFHLNGHIMGFRPQTQKLESPYKTPPSTPAVKGLRRVNKIEAIYGRVRVKVKIELLSAVPASSDLKDIFLNCSRERI